MLDTEVADEPAGGFADRAPEAVHWRRHHTDGPRPVLLPDGRLRLIDDPTPPAGALISDG